MKVPSGGVYFVLRGWSLQRLRRRATAAPLANTRTKMTWPMCTASFVSLVGLSPRRKWPAKIAPSESTKTRMTPRPRSANFVPRVNLLPLRRRSATIVPWGCTKTRTKPRFQRASSAGRVGHLQQSLRRALCAKMANTSHSTIKRPLSASFAQGGKLSHPRKKCARIAPLGCIKTATMLPLRRVKGVR